LRAAYATDIKCEGGAVRLLPSEPELKLEPAIRDAPTPPRYCTK